MQEKISAQYKNEIDMAKAQRDYELKKAAYDIEVNTKRAESEMAYQLQVHRRAQEAAHFAIWSLSWICILNTVHSISLIITAGQTF